MIPGVSRSGATRSAARARGFGRREAAELSREVALPVLAGAAALKGARLFARRPPAATVRALAAGTVAAAASTWAALRLEREAEPPLAVFAAYRVVLAAVILAGWRRRQRRGRPRRAGVTMSVARAATPRGGGDAGQLRLGGEAAERPARPVLRRRGRKPALWKISNAELSCLGVEYRYQGRTAHLEARPKRLVQMSERALVNGLGGDSRAIVGSIRRLRCRNPQRDRSRPLETDRARRRRRCPTQPQFAGPAARNRSPRTLHHHAIVGAVWHDRTR